MNKRPNRYTYYKGEEEEDKKRPRKEKSTILSSLGGFVGSMFKMLRNATSTSDQDDEAEPAPQQTEQFQSTRQWYNNQRASRQGYSSYSNRADSRPSSQVGFTKRVAKLGLRMFKNTKRHYQEDLEQQKKAPVSRSFRKVIREPNEKPQQPETFKPKLENLVAKKHYKARWLNDQYVEDQMEQELRQSRILNSDMRSSQEKKLFIMELGPEQIRSLRQSAMWELDFAKYQVDQQTLTTLLGQPFLEPKESGNRLSDSIVNQADRSHTSTAPSHQQSGVKREEPINITNTTSESKRKIKIEPPSFNFNSQPYQTVTNQNRQIKDNSSTQSNSLFPQTKFELKTPQRIIPPQDNQNHQQQQQVPQQQNQTQIQQQQPTQPRPNGSPKAQQQQDVITLSVEKIKEISETDLPNPMAPTPNEQILPSQTEPKQSSQKKNNFIDLTVQSQKQSVQKQEVIQPLQVEPQPQIQITSQVQEQYNPFLNKGQQQPASTQQSFQTTEQTQNYNPFLANNQTAPTWSGLNQNPFNNPQNVSNTFNQLFQPAQPQIQSTIQPLGQNQLFANNQSSMFPPISSQSSLQTPSWGQSSQNVDLFNNNNLQQQQQQSSYTQNLFQTQQQQQQPSSFYQPQQTNPWSQPNPIFPSIQNSTGWLPRQEQTPFYNPPSTNFFQSNSNQSIPMETQRPFPSSSDWGSNNNLSSMSFGKQGDQNGGQISNHNPFPPANSTFDPARTNMFMGPSSSLSAGSSNVVNLFTAPQRLDQTTQNLFGTIEPNQSNTQRSSANDSRMNTLRRNINQSNSQRI